MSAETKTVREALLWGTTYLSEKGVENARLDAELLLAFVMQKTRAGIFACLGDEISEAEVRKFESVVYKRGRNFPLQYIVGEQEFMSRPFRVKEGVLIPRSDTETLVETILELDAEPKTILEIGTGSGIIAVSLAAYIDGCTITAVDISEKAVELARENAERFELSDRIQFIRADIFEWMPEGGFDLILSNPPYIPAAEIEGLQKEVQFEPREALDGGGSGFRFFYRLAFLAQEHLETGGFLVLEIGCDQAQAVRAIIEDSPALEILRVVKDCAGRDRVIVSEKTAGG